MNTPKKMSVPASAGHSGLEPESTSLKWIPAEVYPVLRCGAGMTISKPPASAGSFDRSNTNKDCAGETI